jgi:predicted lipid-binding transport protein (Tim44 family)
MLPTLRRLFSGLGDLVRRIARELVPRWVVQQLPAPARWIGSVLFPRGERGFGSRWLLGTLAIAAAIGLLVALLVSPVAGLLALLVVAIWALVHHARGAHARRASNARRASTPSALTPSGSATPSMATMPSSPTVTR